MPVKLDKVDDVIRLTLNRLSREDFDDALQIVKAVPGRRWDADAKQWTFPAQRMAAERLVHLLKPEQTTAFNSWFVETRRESTDAVTTDLPADAPELPVPWADKLFPYQRAAVSFLGAHPKSILADEMGLGKTIEAISVVTGYGFGITLVVCPNSVARKWKREIETWADEPAVIIDGKNPAARLKQLEKGKEAGWVIVNWEKLRIMPQLAEVEWGAVIADEAHRAKNRKAKQTKALWKLRAPIQLALTGTPIQNSPDELWSLLKWLYPKDYTSYWRFFNDYVDYYEGHFGRIITGVKNADELRFELSDKLVRRDKSVLGLPPITWDYVPIELTPKQRKLYTEAEKEIWIKIEADARGGDKGAARMLDDIV